MSQSDIVRIRTDSEVKKQVAKLAEELGMNTTTVVNIFFRAFLRNGGIPFDVALSETPDERKEIECILRERTDVASNPDTKWMTTDDVRKALGL